MVRVKFRNLKTRQFEFWTNVPNEYFRRISGQLIPYTNQQMQFWIANPSPRIIPPAGTIIPNALIFNVTNLSYYIEGGLLYSEVEYPRLASLLKENFTHFRIVGNAWQPIANIWLGNFGIVSYEEMIFSPISSMHFVDFITERDNINELTEKSFDELKAVLGFKEMILI